jgi:tetratricopeptide (TPR) repeat protein
MTDRDREHRYSEGQGFGEPYEGFDIDPAELTVDVDPSQVDPVDSHALPDLLDEGTIPKDAVDAEELLDVGVAYMGIERFEQATETFERAARFADDDRIEQEAWANKGAAHAELAAVAESNEAEEWDAAIGAFKEAIHIDDDSEHAATAENNLAHAYWEFGEDAKALEHAERAIEIDERFAEAWYNRAFFLNERGLAEQALDSVENAIRLGYKTAPVLDEKVKALEALGEYDEAEEVAERADELREQAEEGLVG